MQPSGRRHNRNGIHNDHVGQGRRDLVTCIDVFAFNDEVFHAFVVPIVIKPNSMVLVVESASMTTWEKYWS